MGYETQDRNESATVKVYGGNTDGASRGPQTDIIISEPGYPNDHRHIVFDQYGNQVYDSINRNH